MTSRQHSPTDDLRDLRAVYSASHDLTAPERAVMAVLILHRNGRSGRCDPSLTTIGDEAGLGRSTVVRALDALETVGAIHRDRKRDGQSRTNYRIIQPPTSPTTALVPERDQSQSGTGVVPERDRTSATAGPERTKQRTKERNGEKIIELWDVWLDELGGTGRAPSLTDKRRKRLASLYSEQLKDRDDPVALFRQILRRVKASDHHMSTRAYQLPESLFRNAERRERWTLEALDNGAGTNGGGMTAEELRKWDEAL